MNPRPLMVIPLSAGPSMVLGPSMNTVESSAIVSPARLGSKRMVPPVGCLAAQRSDPTSLPPLLVVTITTLIPDDALAVGVDSFLGPTGSSAQAASAASVSASGQRPTR